MKKRQICVDYCGVACVNGSCPNAVYNDLLYADYGPDPADIGLDGHTKCCDCHLYKGCEDCYFAGRDPSDELYCEYESTHKK